LRAAVANYMGPSTSQTSVQTSAVTFAAGDDESQRSSVRVGPIPTDIPAWARQQPNDPTPPETIVSNSGCRPLASSPPLGPLMTVAEAATILRVSTRTIRRLIERGELDAVRVGRSVRIRPADIMDITLGNSND
jgi:excisionase family DNA binding protein